MRLCGRVRRAKRPSRHASRLRSNDLIHFVRELLHYIHIKGDAERMRIFLNAYIFMIFYDKLMKFFLFAILFSSSFQIFFPILISTYHFLAIGLLAIEHTPL